jgi:hypothetical protein
MIQALIILATAILCYVVGWGFTFCGPLVKSVAGPRCSVRDGRVWYALSFGTVLAMLALPIVGGFTETGS